jgi:CIC family chloride channel protein
MFISAVLIGVVAGVGALLFRLLLGFFHNLFFLGKFSVFYDANLHTAPSPFGIFIILAPVVGIVVVIFLVRHFAPEAKGHGVPEVMDAIYYRKGIIRPVVVVIKAIASAVNIGSGGSVGREGPIIQIGSAFGSYLAQIMRASLPQRVTLIAAGAAGGIAATFNTPIGAVLFAVEIVLHEISVKTLVPVAISTVTATYIGRLFFGAHPSFVIPSFQTPYFEVTNPLVLLSYAVLGIIMGLVSVAYIRALYGAEDFMDERFKNPYVRGVIGMLIVGTMFYIVQRTSGHYHIEGVGYATIQDILMGSMDNVLPLLLVLTGLKLLSTSLTLGSGGSGGIFSPSLFMGAAVGEAFGILIHVLLPKIPISPAAFAVAGMAGLVGGATGAAVTAIVMIFEMTLDYNVVIPMTLTVAISYGIRNALCPESIYTMKLARRGHELPKASLFDVSRLRPARLIMAKRVAIVSVERAPKDIIHLVRERAEISWYLLENAGKISGILSRNGAMAAVFDGATGKDLVARAAQRYIVVNEETKVADIIIQMQRAEAGIALVRDRHAAEFVTEAESIVGVVSRGEIGQTFAESAEMYS